MENKRGRPVGTTKKLDEDLIKEILDKYNSGVKLVRIEKDYKLSKYMVRKICTPSNTDINKQIERLNRINEKHIEDICSPC